MAEPLIVLGIIVLVIIATASLTYAFTSRERDW